MSNITIFLKEDKKNNIDEMIAYINKLKIPYGYSIRILKGSIEYLRELYESRIFFDNKDIHLFISEEVFIVDKEFFVEIINEFNKREDLYICGVKGSYINLDTLNIKKIYGNYYGYLNNSLTLFSNPPSEDINFIYDSIVFVRGDYILKNLYEPLYMLDNIRKAKGGNKKVGLLFLKEPSCIFNEESIILSREEKLEFIRRNSMESEYPLVSILIPTYNQTKYLKTALQSAIDQTYPNIEIILSDDSTTEEVKNFINPYLDKYNFITYVKHDPSNDFGLSNTLSLPSLAKGEYLSFLFHDDVFRLDKIEKMVGIIKDRKDISFVTSQRGIINSNGEFLSGPNHIFKAFNEDTLITRDNIGDLLIDSKCNFLGEPSVFLFKKSLKDRLFNFNNNKYISNGDLASCINFLIEGNGYYIGDTLSYFRYHSEQNTHNINLEKLGRIEWKELYLDMFYSGLLSFKEKFCINCSNRVSNFNPFGGVITQKVESFNIIGSDVINHSCPHCRCHDRERHLLLYIYKLDLVKKYMEGKKVLHIAPEVYIRSYLNDSNLDEYVCGDLNPIYPGMINMDITNIPYEDEYFDFIICNHVLEHIEDDIKALKEISRVLKKGGRAILQTPYSEDIEVSYEDNKIKDPLKRLLEFGQEDHVRIYGKDFFKRIESSGLKKDIYISDELFKSNEEKLFGFNKREDLLMFLKE
ncbi:glycosyltransferase [Clostridium hydrogeniformans]|uniref:glycosyltransferase n=1 Tax=Clostridium hydrogeniformans TaxID=349933 RepID=UPI000480228D|nr:glycosyltransferase [Clostridium hydrogeniformans]